LEQRIVEDPIKKCPKCGADTAKRQISQGAGFILKGGGWYADGYGSKKASSGEATPNAGDAKSPAKTDGGDSGAAKTDDTKKTSTETSSPAAGTSGDTKGGGSKASAA
jgi:putative FmdB family regulatory protein